MLQQDLCRRFGSAQMLRPSTLAFLLPVSWIILDVQGKRLMVGVRRRRAPVDTPKKFIPIWDLVMEPLVRGMPLKQRLKLDKEYAKVFMVVSMHLHQLLLKTPGLTSLCWSFVGWRDNVPRIPSVRTPAELPWDEATKIDMNSP
jgi:hypothetical protein